MDLYTKRMQRVCIIIRVDGERKKNIFSFQLLVTYISLFLAGLCS